MPPRRPLVRPIWPHAIEAAYRRRLLARASAMRDLLTERLLTALRRLAPEIEGRADALAFPFPDGDQLVAEGIAEVLSRRTDAEKPPALTELLRVVANVHAAWVIASPAVSAGLATTGAQLALFAATQTDRVLGIQAIGVAKQLPAATKAVATWAKENGALIKSIDARYFDDIEKVISESVRKGTQTSQISKDLQERYQVSRSRADLIARDQIAKLNSAITEQKYKRLGITSYTWSTSHDERVRPEHRVLDGRVFEWAEPPIISASGERGHPGQACRCRCVALPFFEDDDPEVPFVTPTLTRERPTIYGSRDRPGALPR